MTARSSAPSSPPENGNHFAGLSPQTWNAWVTGRRDGHLLQLAEWGTLKSRFGWRTTHVSLLDGAHRPIAGSQLLLRRAMGLTMAYAPRGPLTDWYDRATTQALLQEMRAAARNAGASVLKVEPELADTPEHRALLRSYALLPSSQMIQPRSSIVVDITGTEDQILAQMKSKWRYNIRLAQRRGVSVREMDWDDLPTFDALMQETGARDEFAVHSPAYYAAAFELLVPDHAVFLLAEHEGLPLGAIVVGAVGYSACYLWGASSERERQRMPNHALQWAGICWARTRGAARYDLWGIPDLVGELAQGLTNGTGGLPAGELPVAMDALPGDGLWGVFRFKQGFGGQVVRTVGAWDMVLNPVGYAAYSLGVKVRGKLDDFDPGELGSVVRGASPATKNQAMQTGSARERSSPGGICLRAVGTPGEWRSVMADLPHPHILQSWEWGEIKTAAGWHAVRMSLHGETGRAAFQFLWRQPIAGLPLRVGYVPKGPLLDWADLDLVDITLDAIQRQARFLGCCFVKIDPDVRDDTPVGKLVLHTLARRGWRFSADQVQYKNTAWTDLTAGEDALLAAMKSKWRYNVRLAEKRGVTVRAGGEGDLAAFYALYAETGARDGFVVRPFDYYVNVWRTVLRAEADPANPAGGVLLLAEHKDDIRPIAGLFIMRYGERAWYFYGASSDRRRRDMPNYLLQWAALRWALVQGCTAYDWWGAPTDLADPHDEMQGVWYFKQGFGANFRSQIGAWDYVVAPIWYRLYAQLTPAMLGAMRRLRYPWLCLKP